MLMRYHFGPGVGHIYSHKSPYSERSSVEALMRTINNGDSVECDIPHSSRAAAAQNMFNDSEASSSRALIQSSHIPLFNFDLSFIDIRNSHRNHSYTP